MGARLATLPRCPFVGGIASAMSSWTRQVLSCFMDFLGSTWFSVRILCTLAVTWNCYMAHVLLAGWNLCVHGGSTISTTCSPAACQVISQWSCTSIIRINWNSWWISTFFQFSTTLNGLSPWPLRNWRGHAPLVSSSVTPATDEVGLGNGDGSP
jgi:hypothetical protein